MLMITHSLEPEFGQSIMERFDSQPGVVVLNGTAQSDAAGRVREFLAAEPSNRVLVFVDFAAERLSTLFQQEANVQQTALKEWTAQVAALLEIHKQDRKRIRLVNFASAAFDPHALKDEFHVMAELPLSSPDQALGMLMVEKQISGDNAELDLRLRASTRTYNESALTAENAQKAAQFVTAQQSEIASLQNACEELQSACDEVTSSNTQKDSEIQDLDAQVLSFKLEVKSTQAELNTAKASNQELTRENTLLLDQLHKVQEELERKFLEAAEQEKRLSQLTVDLDKERSARKAEQKASKQQLEKLAAKSEKDLQDKQTELATEKANSIKVTEQLKTQHAKELDSLDASLKTEQTKTQDLTEENELILNQLHLVQEELERYYQELRSTKQLSDSHARKFQQLNENMKLQSRKHSRAQVQLNQVQNAFSWKLTKVFRSAVRLYPKVRLSEQVELLKASDLFDETWYLKTYPDVQKAGLDAAVHYLRHGAKEGRNPGPNFDSQWYLKQYPDVGQAKMNPLVHYILYGIEENRKVSPRLLTHCV